MAGVTVAFDTLKAATRLRRAGFDEDKARALVSTFAEGMVENLATKQDLVLLATKEDLVPLATKEEIDRLATKDEIVKLASKGEVAALRADVATKAEPRTGMTAKDELAALRAETKAGFEMLRTELIKFQERMTVRMGTAIGAAVAILVAVDKLL